ncbi:MAG: hypothetical protein VKO39_13835 [Cyanobacteriota bacterium]|nr:hypothetical protein [Cyanobacteriota bacterium]
MTGIAMPINGGRPTLQGDELHNPPEPTVPAEALGIDPDAPPIAVGTLQSANLCQPLRDALVPALEALVAGQHLEGLGCSAAGPGAAPAAARMRICW